MPTKIRPSQKESIKDATGRPTGMWQWKHFYLKQATTEEILKESGMPHWSALTVEERDLE